MKRIDATEAVEAFEAALYAGSYKLERESTERGREYVYLPLLQLFVCDLRVFWFCSATLIFSCWI